MLQFLDVLTQVRFKMVELSKYELTLLDCLFKIVVYVKTVLSLHFTLKHNLVFSPCLLTSSYKIFLESGREGETDVMNVQIPGK